MNAGPTAIERVEQALAERMDKARAAWEAVQHGKRGERWAAANARYTEACAAYLTMIEIIRPS